MNIQEKIDIFESSCNRLLAKDSSQLNKAINDDIQKQISDELEEYQRKEEFAYNKKIENLEKNFNKEIYSLEMEAKKEVLLEKKNIQKNLKKEVEKVMVNFTNTPEYADFLFKSIEECLSKIENINNSKLKIIKKDFEKYSR